MRNLYVKKKKANTKRPVVYGILAGAVLIIFALGSKSIFSDTKDKIQPQSVNKTQPRSIDKIQPQSIVLIPSTRTEKQKTSDDGLWDGPVLFHKAGSQPIHLILVEKAIQKLHLYRYDGDYQHIKTYSCSTGEQQGTKQEEKDEKTPEGIYFNVKSYRDNKITLFGDRAFGLSYPDAFDDLAGYGGSGIFIHGSNQAVKPFSTNGCVALDNQLLADLDKRIEFKKTPVIIGKRLPYRFAPAEREISELVPFFKQAMVPKQYARLKSDFQSLTVLGFQERVVAVGEMRFEAAGELHGLSRLYLAGPGKNFLVLIKREWSETTPKIALAREKPRPVRTEADEIASIVESWRKAWETKRLNDYIAHYHPDFVSSGKDLKAWKQYKESLNRRYRQISVTVSGLKVRVEGEKVRVYFEQRYRSDTFSSDGYKRIELRKKDGSWKIYRERAFPRKPDGWPS
jgi:murein L,D-transpeptidase YafK